MRQETGFQDAIEMLRNWDRKYQEQFYQLFPETVRQEATYDLMGVRQHEEEGFAADLENQKFEERELDTGTHRSLKSQLAHLSTTAAKEAAATQNLTVYNHAEKLWQEAEDTEELLDHLEAYAEERTDWGERKDQEKTDEELLQEPRLDYGNTENKEYVEEILTQLVTETMHEV
ncbi:MAG: hypothetical protein ABEK04_03850 [Candidatus Nanohalobium sp.]